MKLLKFSIIFLLAFGFLGCATKPSSTTSVITFPSSTTFGSRLLYNATKSAAGGVIERPSPSEDSLVGLARIKDLGNELLSDIGGISIILETEDHETLEGFYFDPKEFRARQMSAYKKWRSILKSPRNCRLSEMFESEFSGGTMLSLLSLPNSLHTLANAKRRPLGVLVLPEYGLSFQLDPKIIVNYLARGMHVFAINYRGDDKIPEWQMTCNDAQLAFNWLKARLKLPSKELVVCGKSFGSGPAIYLGTQEPGVTLILERPFARMSDLCEYHQKGPIASLASPFAKSFIEKYFRYPNEDWIKKVRGKVLFLESVDDEAIKGHTQRLVKAMTSGLTEKEQKEFEDKFWIKIRGSHFGRFWGDQSCSWYGSEVNQNKLTRFLEEL